jgi:hypothetical protein
MGSATFEVVPFVDEQKAFRPVVFPTVSTTR